MSATVTRTSIRRRGAALSLALAGVAVGSTGVLGVSSAGAAAVTPPVGSIVESCSAEGVPILTYSVESHAAPRSFLATMDTNFGNHSASMVVGGDDPSVTRVISLWGDTYTASIIDSLGNATIAALSGTVPDCDEPETPPTTMPPTTPTTVPEPTIPEPTIPPTTVPEPTIPEPTIPEPTVPEPEPTVPDSTVAATTPDPLIEPAAEVLAAVVERTPVEAPRPAATSEVRSLAFTGSSHLVLVALGAVLVALGGLCARAARRDAA